MVSDRPSDTIKRRPPFSILGCYVLYLWEGREQNIESAQRVGKSKAVLAPPPFVTRPPNA